MTSTFNTQFFRFLLIALVLCSAANAFAQEDKYEGRNRSFCSGETYRNGNQVSFREAREMTVSAGSLIDVDARRNGGISIKGENRSDVLVRACIQTSGATEQDAQAAAKNIRIETGSTIHAEGTNDEMNWAVSYEILVPRASALKLRAHNGGISINAVEGAIDFETVNGGVNVRDAAGSIKGRTSNGGVNVVLAGTSWRGSGIDIETTNGGVRLQIPETFQAHLETGTVNGRFTSTINGLSVPEDDYRNGRISKKRISVDLNGGGAPVRIVTTNGGISIGNVMTKVI